MLVLRRKTWGWEDRVQLEIDEAIQVDDNLLLVLMQSSVGIWERMAGRR